MSAPLLVVDAAEDERHRGRPYLTGWLQRLGIDPVYCFRVEVYADGDGSVHAFHYLRDEAGHIIAGADATFEYWDETVSLTAPIPRELTLPRAEL